MRHFYSSFVFICTGFIFISEEDLVKISNTFSRQRVFDSLRVINCCASADKVRELTYIVKFHTLGIVYTSMRGKVALVHCIGPCFALYQSRLLQRTGSTVCIVKSAKKRLSGFVGLSLNIWNGEKGLGSSPCKRNYDTSKCIVKNQSVIIHEKRQLNLWFLMIQKRKEYYFVPGEKMSKDKFQ